MSLGDFVRRHRAGLIVCAVLLAIGLFFAGRAYIERPKDLAPIYTMWAK